MKYAVEPDGKRYVEVRQPLSRNDKDDPQTMPIAIGSDLKRFMKSEKSDSALIKASLTRRSGMPVLVSSGEQVQSHTVPPVGLESTAVGVDTWMDRPEALRA